MICCPPPPSEMSSFTRFFDFISSHCHDSGFFSLKTLASVCVSECLKTHSFLKAFHFLYFCFIQDRLVTRPLSRSVPMRLRRDPRTEEAATTSGRRRRSVEEIQQVWCGTERNLPKKGHLEVVVCTSAIKGHFVIRRRIVLDQKLNLGSITSSASSAKAKFLLLNSSELRILFL